MSVVLTTAEINILWRERKAQQDYVYVCEDGFLYKGLKDGTLIKVPNTNLDDWNRQKKANTTVPSVSKTVSQGASDTNGEYIDVKVTSEGKTIIDLPENASTEGTQLEILNEVKSNNSLINTQNEVISEMSINGPTGLNQYTEITLLNLIYEELKEQTKILKKIYQ